MRQKNPTSPGAPRPTREQPQQPGNTRTRKRKPQERNQKENAEAQKKEFHFSCDVVLPTLDTLTPEPTNTCSRTSALGDWTMISKAPCSPPLVSIDVLHGHDQALQSPSESVDLASAVTKASSRTSHHGSRRECRTLPIA